MNDKEKPQNRDDDLGYDPRSLAGSLDPADIREFEEWLHASEYHGIVFEDVYVRHLAAYHGGRPRRRCFSTQSGTEHVVERFLNFAKKGHPLREYGVKHTWSVVSDRMGNHLMPFAELFAGDLLCFDFGKPGRPRVVVWLHELSEPDEDPKTELVADTFDDFLRMLHE